MIEELMEYPSDLYDASEVEFSVLLNKTLSKVDVFRKFAKENDLIVFTTDSGDVYYMTHWRQCCEKVYLQDIIGHFDDLVGMPLRQAEKVTNVEKDPKETRYVVSNSAMWTFYKLATLKGYVTLRWYGTSNGYYGVGVSFLKQEKENED